MGAHAATVTISDDVYAAAEKIAAMDHVSVGVLIESLVKRHAEYIDALNAFSEMPRFSLDQYQMQRDPGETDEEYQARADLFK
jgi:predicted CopG family antitoxin